MLDILKDPKFQKKRHELVHGLPSRHYIGVDEFTTEEDVRGAFNMIAAVQQRDSKGGAPRRDRLTAVECAVLFDRHHWKLKELAERYDWTSRDTARAHIKLGRQILENPEDQGVK